MVKTIVEPLEGFEDIFDELNAKKAGLEEEKTAAIEQALAEVDAKFVEKLNRIDRALETVSQVSEVEVEDEAEVAEEVVEGEVAEEVVE